MPVSTKKPKFGVGKTLTDRIEHAIDTFVDKNAMFTLLDISETVKQDGGDWVSHSKMKPEVEQLLAQKYTVSAALQNYTYDTIKVKTQVGGQARTVDARLFFPVGSDPADYKSRNQNATAPGKRKVQTHHATNTARSTSKARSARQSDGYVEVPKKIWEKAGFTPNDAVVIDVGPNSLTIYVNSANSKYKQATLNKKANKAGNFNTTLPAAGRFRLSPKWLAAANLAGKDVDFSQFTSKIVVAEKV